jgi:peptide/nickel transport system ATP-binding protein/oligopeptide transport system ATP-binding protein
MLVVNNVRRYFRSAGFFTGSGSPQIRAIDGVSLTMNEGEIVGLVGESGCGKTTLGRIIVGLDQPTEGEIYFRSKRLSDLRSGERRQHQRQLQMVFQDPFSSLNPSYRIYDVLWEGYRFRNGARQLSQRGRRETLQALMEMVRLSPDLIDAYPHQLSGGQRQRVNIARAMSVDPLCIIADEPTSALDVSVQAGILNLFIDLQQRHQLTYLFISHDLAAIQYLADRIIVMYLGVFVEQARIDDIFQNPLHPYTQALLSAVPSVNDQALAERPLVEGDLPSPTNPPSGCRFHPRCPFVMDQCRTVVPEFQRRSADHWIACHLYD